MISTEFAPNEELRDAIAALKLLVQPWRWRRGKDIINLKRRLKTRFFSNDTSISLYLTGRAALYQYISTLHLTPGDQVLVQAFTCEAVILPLLERGLEPVYVDITDEDYAMNSEDLKKKYTKKAKVLILQHTFGITPRDRDAILSFASRQKLEIIEDVSHGFDPTLFRNKRFTSAVLLSFGRSKAFSSVFGGAVAVRRKRIIQALHDLEKNLPSPPLIYHVQMLWYKILTVIIKQTYGMYLGKILHYLARHTNMLIPEISKKEKRGEFDTQFLRTYPNSAAIMMHTQLDRFNDVLKLRKKNVAYYDTHLDSPAYHYKGSLILYPLRSQHPDALQKHAAKKKIFLGRWYRQVVAPVELDLHTVKYLKGSCPVAERLCTEIINLPTTISTRQTKQIVTLINSSTV